MNMHEYAKYIAAVFKINSILSVDSGSPCIDFNIL